jgi:aspartyl/asparaginyl-tRNA synthetase
MAAATAAGQNDPASGYPSSPQAAMFTPQGRPRPLARRLAIHNRVVHTIRGFFADRGFHEIPVTAMADYPARIQLDGMILNGFPNVWCESELLPRRGRAEPRHLRGFKLMEAAGRDLPLEDLVTLQEDLLKAVAVNLSADLLGGRDVTRLDRMLHVSHPRLTYRRALETLGVRGWDIPFGDELHAEAEATLSRYCGNLPFIVTHLPASLVDEGTSPDPDDPAVTVSAEYILPFSGITMEGSIRPGAPLRSGFSLGLGHLLQFLMGLGSVMDTLIDPMDRLARLMKTTSSGDAGPRRDGGAG